MKAWPASVTGKQTDKQTDTHTHRHSNDGRVSATDITNTPAQTADMGKGLLGGGCLFLAKVYRYSMYNLCTHRPYTFAPYNLCTHRHSPNLG